MERTGTGLEDAAREGSDVGSPLSQDLGPQETKGNRVTSAPPPGADEIDRHFNIHLLQAAWIGVLLAVAFAPALFGIIGSWFDESADMAHGPFVVPAALAMVWSKREALKRLKPVPTPWALLIVLWGALQAIAGSLAQWLWVSRSAFLISLAGCLIALYGRRIVRALAYPLCLLILMIAPPSFLYERVTLPLQLLASQLGELMLEACGYSILREGNILQMVGQTLAVEETCSGIRSLIALLFLGFVYCYFFVPQRVVRAILLFSTVPIAILSNGTRIFATGVAGQYDSDLAHGVLHPALGHVTLLAAVLLCFLLHRVLDRYVVS